MNSKTRKLTAIALLAVAAVCTAYGIHNGEVLIVLKKATTVCLECIGLG